MEKRSAKWERVVTAGESGIGWLGTVLPYESPQLGIAAPNPAFGESCHHTGGAEIEFKSLLLAAATPHMPRIIPSRLQTELKC